MSEEDEVVDEMMVVEKEEILEHSVADSSKRTKHPLSMATGNWLSWQRLATGTPQDGMAWLLT